MAENILQLNSFTYKYIPQAQAKNIFVVLHGLGDSALGYEWLPNHLNFPNTSYLLLNAPDEYYGGYSWFDFPSPIKPGIDRSRKLLESLAGELNSQGFPYIHQYFFGFSQGCLMVLDLALRFPHLLGGICGVSGYLGLGNEYPEKLSEQARSQKIWLTHGTYDPLLPEVATAAEYKKLIQFKINYSYKVYPKDHTMIAEEIEEIRNWFLQIMH